MRLAFGGLRAGLTNPTSTLKAIISSASDADSSPFRKLASPSSKDVKTVQLIDLPVRSQDALEVLVDVNFQYELKIELEELVGLHYKWEL